MSEVLEIFIRYVLSARFITLSSYLVRNLHFLKLMTLRLVTLVTMN